MNKFKSCLIALAALVGAMPAMAQQHRVASTGGISPHETTSAVIGDRRTGCRVTITYGRPYSVKPGTTEKRKIWGSLVPYGQPWRMGSDEATTLITEKPLQFGNTTIPAGAYTLYMVPEENGPSKLVFSSHIGKWGIPVDTSHDVASVELKKEALATPVHQFTMAIGKTDSGGVIKLSWEDAEYSAPFTLKQ